MRSDPCVSCGAIRLRPDREPRCEGCAWERDAERTAVARGLMERSAWVRKWKYVAPKPLPPFGGSQPSRELVRESFCVAGDVFYWRNQPYLTRRGLRRLLAACPGIGRGVQ